MKIYFVQYRWKEIVEEVYEYVIAECEKIFGIVNHDCLFRIEPDCENKSLTIGVLHDDNEQFFIDYLEHHDLEYTGLHYKQLLSTSQSVYIKRTDKIDYLADNEIRYVKFSYNDISRIMIAIVAEWLKIREYSSIMIQKDKDLYTFYISKHDFNYEVIKGDSSVIKFVDKTSTIVGKFV